MAARTIQGALNWGEISPAFYGRVELPQYRAGCSTMRNMFVRPQGGAVSRAGTKYVGQCLEPASATSTPPQIIPFVFNVQQSYGVELGDQYMRFIFDGAYVLEDSFTVSSATNASPGVIHAAGNDFAVDDWVYLAGLGGMTEINGHTYAVDSIPTTGSFTLRSTLTGTALDTTDFGTYTSGGAVARILTIDTPYAIADVETLKFTQSNDVMSITHGSYKPMDLTRIAANDFTLTTTSFDPGIVAPLSVFASPRTTTSATVSTQYQYLVTAIDALTGEESIGSLIATVTNSVNIALTLGANTITWDPVTGASQYNIYKAPASYGGQVPVGSLFGYMATSFGLSYVDTNVVPDFTVTPPLHYNPFATSSIQYFIMTSTGASYTSSTSPPVVSIGDPTGHGAFGYGVVVGGGILSIILMDGGEGYTDPDVQIATGGTGTGAIVLPIIGPGSFWHGATTVSVSGSLYQAPVFTANWQRFNGHTGTDLATSVVVSGGHIVSVVFPDRGGSFDAAIPTTSVTITVVDGSGSGADATAVIGPSSGTYPSVVAYFQQRRFYANTDNQPDTYWGSQPGAYTNFDRSIPITDSDSIVGTPWAQQINGIQWMIPMPGGLVVLTGKGAWQVNGGQPGVPITPADQNAQSQAYNGVSPRIQPITINYEILYVQQEGSIVRDLSYDIRTNIYSGTDITVMSNHLFDNFQIDRWDWAEERHKCVWVVRNDGRLLSLSYLKEQNVFGWSRHDTPGVFESVACISEPPVDAPYFIVKRYVAGRWVYYMERMDNRLWSDIESAWCLDSALAYPQSEPDATLTASGATGGNAIAAYDILTGGTGYTAPVGMVIDDGGTGTGATVVLLQVGGVITEAQPGMIGAGYSGPVRLVISDETGTGAVIEPLITNYVTLSASANVFDSGNVGDIVRAGGGKLEIVQFNEVNEVVANVLQPITFTMPNDPNNMPLPIAAGDWTMAAPTDTVSGLDHLEGMKVMGLADGGVIGPLTVTGGSVDLPYPASKILIGLAYAVQMQTLYLETPGGGTIQGRRKQTYDVVLRVEGSRPPTVGSNQPDAAVQPNYATVPWTGMSPVQDRSPAVLPGQPMPLYTGDLFTNVAANWDENSQVAVEQLDPVPLTILALIPNFAVGDTPG